MRLVRSACLLPLLVCMGCSTTLTPQDFAGHGPDLVPDRFFVGHVHSWGIVETADGQPTERFETDANGTLDADGTLRWPQTLTFDDGTVQQRDWVFHRTGDHTYEGTANDVDGVARGEAYGNLFHLKFTLETSPGNSLKNVQMEEWMIREPDGGVVNRVTVRKLGLTIAMVTEYFENLGK
jgi:hypothetical protein